MLLFFFFFFLCVLPESLDYLIYSWLLKKSLFLFRCFFRFSNILNACKFWYSVVLHVLFQIDALIIFTQNFILKTTNYDDFTLSDMGRYLLWKYSFRCNFREIHFINIKVYAVSRIVLKCASRWTLGTIVALFVVDFCQSRLMNFQLAWH